MHKSISPEALGTLVMQAQQGIAPALEALIKNIQDRVHHLAMRILAHPDDAQEATQEILILVVTKLSSFRNESAFTTWVYRVATNYLLTTKKNQNASSNLSFDEFQAGLEHGLTDDTTVKPEDEILLNQLRLSCTMAMLLCLDLKSRMAYVLGEILELDHEEASAILAISKANYRQRLSRARSAITEFTAKNCGVVNSKAKCSCVRKLPSAMAKGCISHNQPAIQSDQIADYHSVIRELQNMETNMAVKRHQQSIPIIVSPEDIAARILDIVNIE